LPGRLQGAFETHLQVVGREWFDE